MENKQNFVGALSCKGEQGCSGDHRRPSGGLQSCNGASDPVFGDYHTVGLISGLACIMESMIHGDCSHMGELS